MTWVEGIAIVQKFCIKDSYHLILCIDLITSKSNRFAVLSYLFFCRIVKWSATKNGCSTNPVGESNYVTFSTLRSVGVWQINHPLCGCVSKVIPKKLQSRYNKGVQAYHIARGEKIWLKKLIVYHIQNGCVNTTLFF